MKGFVRLMAVVVTAAVFVVACSKDKDSGKITLDSPAVFFAQAGGSATVGFTAQNIKTLSATSKPTGWDEAVVDLAGAMISVKAPSSEDIESGDAVKTGSFSFTGYTPGGTLVSATLFAGIVTTKDISAEVANSYIVTEPETNYLIDATRKGDGSQLATSYVDVVWQTASGFVQYADFEDGKASFYIGADSDAATKIKQGNHKKVTRLCTLDTNRARQIVNDSQIQVPHIIRTVVVSDGSPRPVIGFKYEIIAGIDPAGHGDIRMPAVMDLFVLCRRLLEIDFDKCLCHGETPLVDWQKGIF